jgi:hypothetical protein
MVVGPGRGGRRFALWGLCWGVWLLLLLCFEGVIGFGAVGGGWMKRGLLLLVPSFVIICRLLNTVAPYLTGR